MPIDPIFRIARFVLEAAAPLSIGTGSPDGVFDTALVRDANRLPAIPGSSLAGVLRHLYQWETDEDSANALFGFQARGAGHEDNGRSSRLQVAWGCILGQSGEPVEGLYLGERLEWVRADPILGPLLAQADEPVTRNRVRIGARGVAAGTGKFDRAVLPAGHRFACELVLRGDGGEDDAWSRLLALLRDPRLRLGGATRAGLGRMVLQRLHTGRFDLREPDQARAFRALGAGIADTAGLHSADRLPRGLPAGWFALQLHLRARDFWRIGQGEGPLGKRYEKEPDAVPVAEERVAWDDGWQARRELAIPLVPGSSVKGALAHRVAYYANCLEDRWAEGQPDLAAWDKSAEDGGSALVRELFGYSRQNAGAGGPTGQAGRVFIDDACVAIRPEQIAQLMHNAIDRFTGGVRDRLLFSEELLWRTDLTLDCLIDTGPLDATAREVLRLALEDLAEGRLAIGAGAGKGHGLFLADPKPDLDRLFTREDAA